MRNDRRKKINKKKHLLLKKLKQVHKNNRKYVNTILYLRKTSNNRIQVAKIAPEQPVQEQLISSGLRFDSSGHLLPYSILGSVNEYASELSEIEAVEVSLKNKNSLKFSFLSFLQ
jgi:hypothetical protein